MWQEFLYFSKRSSLSSQSGLDLVSDGFGKDRVAITSCPIPIDYQALILGGRLEGFRSWLPASLIGAYLGYFLLIIDIVRYFEYLNFSIYS